MGEEAFLAMQRDAVRRSRERTGNKRGRLSWQAYQKATTRLRELHRAEFDALLSEERYKLGLD